MTFLTRGGGQFRIVKASKGVCVGILRTLSVVNRDGQTIMVARALRTFAHSAASIVLAIYLDIRGFSLAEIGLFLTIGGFGAAAWALATGMVGDTVGRRKMLVVISLFTAASGLSLALTPAYPILVVIGFIGAFTAMAEVLAPPARWNRRALLQPPGLNIEQRRLHSLESLGRLEWRWVPLQRGYPISFRVSLMSRKSDPIRSSS